MTAAKKTTKTAKTSAKAETKSVKSRLASMIKGATQSKPKAKAKPTTAEEIKAIGNEFRPVEGSCPCCQSPADELNITDDGDIYCESCSTTFPAKNLVRKNDSPIRTVAKVVVVEEEKAVEEEKEVLHKSTIESPTKTVWTVADKMLAKAEKKGEKLSRKAVIEACIEMGIAYFTARTQYQCWSRAMKESGGSPSL